MLTTSDRCDRCGAQAFYAAFFASGVLMFCAHHGRQHMSSLVEIAEEIFDGTAAINKKPSISANAT